MAVYGIFQLFQNNFTINQNIFEKEMREFVTPNNYVEINQLSERCTSSFPVRLTVRDVYKMEKRNCPIIVVTFDDIICKKFAWQIGKTLGLTSGSSLLCHHSLLIQLLANQQLKITDFMRQFSIRAKKDEED